jgi:AAT family amino acid transporter/D-serine/D-alanine/glycine transporter
MSLVAWDQLSPTQSPFVQVFVLMGIPAAASIINLVVLTAAASSCNSGIFSTGRMLHALALKGQAPKVFGRLNQNQVPAAGIHASAALMLIAVVLNGQYPNAQVFIWLTSVAVIGTLWTWGIIMVSHYQYRRAVDAGRLAASPFRMPGAPVVNWLVVAFLVGVAVMLWPDEKETRIALYVAPVWFGLLCVSYALIRSKALPAPAPARTE